MHTLSLHDPPPQETAFTHTSHNPHHTKSNNTRGAVQVAVKGLTARNVAQHRVWGGGAMQHVALRVRQWHAGVVCVSSSSPSSCAV